MSESDSVDKNLSDGTKAILSKIEEVIKTKSHPCVKYIRTGVVWKNSREYDLTTTEGRSDFQEICKNTIGYSLASELRFRHKNDIFSIPEIPKKFRIKTNHFEPWLSICFWIDELTYQMETQDFMDSLVSLE